MLHDCLFTSYKRYKADTDYIAHWLATTAKQCGYVTHHDPRETPLKTPNKLKGRARTLARRDAENAKKQEDGASSASYTIAIQDFLPMAQQISSFSKPPVKVPEHFMRVIERAISLRRKVSKAMADPQYSGSSRSSTNLESDSRHAHFVDILVNVQQKLGHLVAEKGQSGPRPQEAAKSDDRSGFNFTNMFDCLSTDDLSTTEQDNDGDKPGQHLHKEIPRVMPDLCCKAERPKDSLEASVAFVCLLSDMQQMREVISDCWRGYQRGTLDLTTAALTSNTAFELAWRLEGDLEDLTGDGNVESLLKSQHAILCQRMRDLPEYTDLSEDDFEFATHNAAPEAFLWSAYKHLRYFLDLGCMKTVVSPSADTYRPESGCSRTLEQQAFLEDRRFLSQVFSDIMVYMGGQDVHGDSHIDELTRGFLDMFWSARVPLWLAFATQVFLDIHHMLHKQIGKGFELLQMVGKMIVLSMEDQAKHHHNGSDGPFHPFAEAFDYLSRMIRDICEEDLLQRARDVTNLFDGQQIESFRFLKMNPISCGIKLYAIKALYRHLALEFVNCRSDAILSCAHLNNALIQEGYMQGRWRDMDFVYKAQDESNLYAGAAPQTPDDCHKRFCLAVLGFSITNFARNRRKPHNIALKANGHRVLEKRTPISDAFFHRYCFQQDRKNLSAQELLDILGTNKRKVMVEASEGEEALMCDIVIPKAPSREPKASKKARRAVTPDISPVGVLRKLRQSLEAESLELSLDYMTMHRICTRLLLSVRDAVATQMQDLYGTAPRQERGLPLVVLFILSTLVAGKGKSKLNILPFRKEGYKGIGDDLMRKAAAQVEEMTSKKREGCECVVGKGLTHGETVVARAHTFTGMAYRVHSGHEEH
ncbi:hypothetical protein G647_08043 [Cladophialophora carrionii CBS 160.54]|uniref:DUF6604 domain-containing protein n=1 Tax=Cladophialophora carrionii CBS 160.54 TaxID=1279043 RepID=V9D4V2_9EURO|nr:uncharacterized protein G647_08043 [Cladophialophora carrionii CBS 160.54]ETI21696.1 hypothetical protein G647_08043 [Cladophialophora carrionii CBS 160.54]